MYLRKNDAPPGFQVVWPSPDHVTLWHLADGDLADRFAAATLIGSADFDARVAPFSKWVTDIGLRVARETSQSVLAFIDRVPRVQVRRAIDALDSFDQFATTIASRYGMDVDARFDHVHWAHTWLDSGEHQVVTHTIAQYVDGVGSQSDAVQISLAVAEYERALARTGTAAFLVLHAACALAVVRDQRCRGLFDRAEERMVDLWDRYFVLLRSLTAEVKRLDGGRVRELRQRGSEHVRSLSREFGDGAGALAEALLLNLDAYRSIRARNRSDAYHQIEQARNLVHHAREVDTGYPWLIASRYYVQVCHNWAHFHLMEECSAGDGIKELERLVDFCRTEEPASLTEALSLFGYSLCQTGNYRSAVAPLEEAERLLQNGISLIRRNTVVGMLAVACDALGRTEESIRWCDELQPGDEQLNQLLATQVQA